MAWFLETLTQDMPFLQWKTNLEGQSFEAGDLQGPADASIVFQKGGRELRPEECPKVIDFLKTNPAVRGINQVQNGALVVSDEFKKVVGQVSAVGIQFVPLEMRVRGCPNGETRWFMNPYRVVDIVDWERSATREKKGFDRVVRTEIDMRKKEVFLAQEPPVEQCHLFRPVGGPRFLVLSDRLKQALDEDKLLKSAPVFECFR